MQYIFRDGYFKNNPRSQRLWGLFNNELLAAINFWYNYHHSRHCDFAGAHPYPGLSPSINS